jgi:hypothetical protein
MYQLTRANAIVAAIVLRFSATIAGAAASGSPSAALRCAS